MTYRMTGLDPAQFADADALVRDGAIRVTATAKPGFPCRVSLEDAEPGEELLLVHHLSHDVATPFRSAYAIYVREAAATPAHYVDAIPSAFATRALSLRGFDADGMLRDALLSPAGEAELGIRDLFERPEIAYINAHYAAYGCFAARIERSDGGHVDRR